MTELTDGLARAASGDAQAVIDVATAATDPHVIDPNQEQVVYVAAPAGADVVRLEVEKFATSPRRKTGIAFVHDVESFVALVREQYDQAETTVWVDVDGRLVTAVLNDHGDAPAWGDHRVALRLQPTDEWKRWTAHDGELRSQADLAELFEEGQLDIVSPPAARMLEVAQSIHATGQTNFRSKIDLHDGSVKFTYDDEVRTTAGAKGEIEIPREFALQLRPFIGERPYKVNALLRWRIRNGALAIGYKLERPDDVLRDAVDAIARRLRSTDAATGEEPAGAGFSRVYLGVPAAAR